MPGKYDIVVAGAAIDGPAEQRRVLIATRPPGKRLAGYWEFPGGKVNVEQCESPEEALAREFEEELSLVVDYTTVIPITHKTKINTPTSDGIILLLYIMRPGEIMRASTALRHSDAVGCVC